MTIIIEGTAVQITITVSFKNFNIFVSWVRICGFNFSS